MSIQLITIVDTKTDGKFVLHKYPPKYPSQIPKSHDPQSFVKAMYSYFGLFDPMELVSTNFDHIQQKAFVEMFSANQKFTSVVVGIDDNCIVVSRSAFIDHGGNDRFSSTMFSYTSAVACLTPVSTSANTSINSVSVCLIVDNYNEIDKLKHLVSYMVNVLEHKENSTRYLTQQVSLVIKEKLAFKNKAREILVDHLKEHPNQQFKTRDLLTKINKEAEVYQSKIDLFRILINFYASIKEKSDFQVPDGQHWESAIGYKFQIPEIQNSRKQANRLANKTVITLPKKLAVALPQMMYTERISKMYQHAIRLNNVPIKTNLNNTAQLSQDSVYHSLNFLIKNNLAVEIYPLNYPKFYNLYAVNHIPHRSTIEKFNTKIFPHSDLIMICQRFSQFGLAVQDRPIKYLILVGILIQVKIYIYKLGGNNHDKKNQNYAHKQTGGTSKKQKVSPQEEETDVSDALIEATLQKFGIGQHDLNQIVSKVTCEVIDMNKILKYIRNNRHKWGYFFVET